MKKMIGLVYYFLLSVLSLLTFWIVVQVFLIASFHIPTESMIPTLIQGDAVLVWKPTLGARLFNLGASLRLEQVNIYRLPGYRPIRRNDILVFNSPYPNGWDRVEMHILKYYVKRCVALPGDTLSIRDGIFRIAGTNETVGHLEAQLRIGKRKSESFDRSIYQCFPSDSLIPWNIQYFGPFYVPKEGDIVQLDQRNYLLYHRLIEWEKGQKLVWVSNHAYMNGEELLSYQFQKNYYFMAGDNGENSQDSRYWGLLPEEFIVGKVALIWKSIDPWTGKIRWDRCLKCL